MKNLKVAIATEFLEQYGGAQRVLEAICELYPNAPVYTAKFNKDIVKKIPTLKDRKIIYPKKGFINKMAKHFFVFALVPILEDFDFSEYDIIISDGTTWTKGIITKPNQLHIDYVHTPARFLYGYSREGTKWDKNFLKIPYSYLLNFLRIWDYVSAQRPDYLLCNSREVQKRIKKFFNRESFVIYPPVSTDLESKEIEVPFEEYFITVGRLSKYKNFDKVIKVINNSKYNLVVVGTGYEEQKLKEMAKSNIYFAKNVNNKEKNYLIKNSKGLINAVQDEDFGIVPVEAIFLNTPVLAHNSGGHKETIKENKNGMLFNELTLDILNKFDENISKGLYKNINNKKEIELYSKERFKREIKQFIEDKYKEFIKDKYKEFNKYNA